MLFLNLVYSFEISLNSTFCFSSGYLIKPSDCLITNGKAIVYEVKNKSVFNVSLSINQFAKLTVMFS